MESAGTDLKARLMVGMEIHVELATRTKMFTSAPNVAHPDYGDAPPNSLCDPVVLGLPGVLPVINRRAVEMAMRVGLALGCRINPITKWDRKSYYYPDLPKNYQISQYDQPLCVEGALDVPTGEGEEIRTIRILRAHLEEDAGKLLHEAPGGLAIEHSIVDLNRAGTPLLEIVTYPDFISADEVVTFAKMLRAICRCLGVTQGIMQKGHMRFEPNINLLIEEAGQVRKTPIVEIKNLNSFKAVHGAIEYERRRQLDEWLDKRIEMKSGSKSTRGWDDSTQRTFLQREKEEAHDYRYFPDPDLVPVVVEESWLEALRQSLPELPARREKRYVQTLELGTNEARQIVEEPEVCAFFEAVMAAGVPPRRAAAVLLNNLSRRANERGCLVSELGITPGQIKSIVDMTAAEKIGSSAADELYLACCEDSGIDPLTLAQARGLLQVSDHGALEDWIEQVMAANPKAVDAVRGGKEAAIGSLVGAVMKLSKGQANAKVVQEKLRTKLMG